MVLNIADLSKLRILELHPELDVVWVLALIKSFPSPFLSEVADHQSVDFVIEED